MGGNIFNGNINGRATAWMMIGMLVFAVIWESFTDWLEHKLHHNKAHSEILQKVYKELMILGFIAFGLIMGKEVGAVTWNAETLHCFEFCDLLVSICVLVYVANCAISSFTLHTVQRDWDRVALMPTTKVIKDAKSYLKKLEASPWMKFKACLPFSGTAWRKDADFKTMQLLFQLKFHMPPQFDYVMYLKLVLEGVVCSMANVTTWHWMIVMLINFVWWLGMVYVYPFLGFPEPPESDKICMALCDSPESRRRLAATAAPEVCRAQLFEDTCAWDGAGLDDAWQKLRSNDSDTSYWSQCAPCLEALRAGPPDITEKETLHSIIIYIAVGWSLVAIQGLIVTSLFRRIDKILAICDGDTDKIQNHEIPGLLTSLAAQVAAAEDDKRSLGDHNPLTERTDLKKKSVLHHTHLVQVEGEADEEETDTLMVFSEVGMTSNDIFSIKKYESLMFLTQMVQLVMDFYVGFYFVHVNQRVPKAFGVKSLTDSDYLDAQTQVLLHAAILSSAVSVVLLVVITTRKITILLGVLHLAEDPVSDVLTHVETVKALRNRIKDRLRTTALRQATPNPDEAQRVLDQLANGEKALLERIDDKEWPDRITRSEIEALFEAHKENLSFTKEMLDKFLSREEYQAFILLPPQEQTAIMTSHTLQVAEAMEDDTVEVGDFAGWVVRRASEVILRTEELAPREGAVKNLVRQLERLSIVDNVMIERGMMVGRGKALFEMADTNKGGTISRNEMQKMMRRFKVPITKGEFGVIWRVIDPDQSGQLELDEWLHFMLAEDDDLDASMMSQTTAAQRENAAKGTGMSVLLQEGTSKFLGETAGKAVGKTAETVGRTVHVVVPREAARVSDDDDEVENPVAEPPAPPRPVDAV